MKSSGSASPSVHSTTKKLPLKDIKGPKIQLTITEKVQNQILTLCHRIHDVEWSGTLFYTTEGDFGTKEFKMTAQEIYLQDVGSAAYTEYEPGNPEFIKFMMARPELMTMRIGHVHSHNKMSVFFSGTDNDELVINAEFHNYYLSLIVNNRNHMEARVAFKGKAEHEISTQLTFKDTDGEEKVRDIVTKQTETAVYAYDCEITIPDLVEEEFDLRYFSLLEEIKKKKEEAEKAKKAIKVVNNGDTIVVTPPPTGRGGGPYGSFDGTKRYREAGLFDDQEDWMKNEKKSVRSKTKVDSRTYTLIAKMVKLDPLYEGQLLRALSMVNKEFYGDNTLSDPNYYLEMIERKAVQFYMDVFPEDTRCGNYSKTIEDCIDILELNETEYPKLVPGLVTALKLSLSEE